MHLRKTRLVIKTCVPFFSSLFPFCSYSVDFSRPVFLLTFDDVKHNENAGLDVFTGTISREINESAGRKRRLPSTLLVEPCQEEFVFLLLMNSDDEFVQRGNGEISNLIRAVASADKKKKQNAPVLHLCSLFFLVKTNGAFVFKTCSRFSLVVWTNHFRIVESLRSDRYADQWETFGVIPHEFQTQPNSADRNETNCRKWPIKRKKVLQTALDATFHRNEQLNMLLDRSDVLLHQNQAFGVGLMDFRKEVERKQMIMRLKYVAIGILLLLIVILVIVLSTVFDRTSQLSRRTRNIVVAWAFYSSLFDRPCRKKKFGISSFRWADSMRRRNGKKFATE